MQPPLCPSPKKLYRAVDQLESMQRQRGGENVPPHLNVNLGKRI